MCYSEWATHGHDSSDVIPARIAISGQETGGKGIKGGGERHQECCMPLGYGLYCTRCLSAPWSGEDCQGLESGSPGFSLGCGRIFSPSALNTSSTSEVKSVPLCISYPFIPWEGSESRTCCVMWGWLPKADFFGRAGFPLPQDSRLDFETHLCMSGVLGLKKTCAYSN